MIIGIDASRYNNTSTPTGVEVYSREVIPRLVELCTKNGHTPLLYTPKKIENFPESIQCILPFPKFWSMIRLAAHFTRKDLHPDVFFVPSHILPPVCPKNSFVTIHDIAYKHFPESYSWLQKRILEFGTKNAIKRNASIITISKATQEDLVHYYSVAPTTVQIIPLGFSPKKTPYSIEEKSEVLSKYQLCEEEFILSIGRIETKKNTHRLCEAFLNASLSSKIKLVCAGTKGIGGENIQKSFRHNPQIVFPGYISEKEASILYDTCAFFTLPSLYEGFGMPILEAYHHGKAVLTSNISSMPEVAGPGAAYIDPLQVTEISSELSHLARDKALRTTLAEKGKKHSETYSWDLCAHSIYKKLIDSTE